MKYVMIIERGTRNFSAYFPDVPGCATMGRTVEETIINADEALSLHLEDDIPPHARSLAEVLADPEVSVDLDGTEIFAPVEYHAGQVPAL